MSVEISLHEAEPARPRAAPLADDLLRGAAEIAEFVYGDPAERRRVYHLATEVKEECRLPVFRLGNILCARRSTLLRWVARQESYSSTQLLASRSENAGGANG